MKQGRLILLALVLSAAASSGCAAAALTLFGVGAGLSADTSTSYILDSITYKTFAVSEAGLHAATLKTLRRMDISVNEDRATEAGRTIVGVAHDRTVEIELDRLTSRTSRMRVLVKQGWFFRDRATAEEIVVQTDQTLADEHAAVRTVRLPAAPPPKPPAASPDAKAQEPAPKSFWEKARDGLARFFGGGGDEPPPKK